MKRFGPQLLFSLLLLIATITLACGSSPHLLQSVTVSPATADAKDFPNGLVQFTATGLYNSSPTRVTPLKANWGVCVLTAGSEQPSNAVTVSSNGLAQCVSGAPGMYVVFAWSTNPTKGAVCNVVEACSGGCGSINGTAQLTCPEVLVRTGNAQTR